MQQRKIRIMATILAAIFVLAATPAMTADKIEFVSVITNATSETIKCVGRLNDAGNIVWNMTLKPGETKSKSTGFTPVVGQSFCEFGLEIDRADGSPQALCGFIAGLKGRPGDYKITSVDVEQCYFKSGDYTYSHEDGTVRIGYTYKGL